MVYEEGGFKQLRQRESLLVLAPLAKQNAIEDGASCSVADCNLGNSLCCCCYCLHPTKSAPSTRQFDWRVQPLQHAIVNGDTIASCRVLRESAIPSCDLHGLYVKKSTMQGLL